MRDNFLSNLKLVVVKVGTSTLSSKSHPMDKHAVKKISDRVGGLLDKGIKVVLVSSGAIGAGMHLLGLKARPKTLNHLQAAAAIGQAQLMTALLGADLLIILSDVDGLYSHMGKKEVIDTVREINSGIEKLACGTDKETCVGGMSTKIRAAKVVTDSGIPMVIANGKTEGILIKIVNKEKVGTIFIPRDK